MIDRDLNPKNVAAVIVLVGLSVFGYVYFFMDWSKFELNYLSVGFPVLFLFLVLLFAYSALFPNKHELTSKETDRKYKAHIDEFKFRSENVRRLVAALAVLFIIVVAVAANFYTEKLVSIFTV